MNQTGHWKGISLAILAALLWGISGSLGQFLIQQRGIDVEWLIAMRMLISGVVLLLIALCRREKMLLSIWKSRKDASKLLTFGVGGILTVQYTYFAAIQHSNAAAATVLQYMGPVFIAVYLATKNKKIPRPIELLAIGLAVLGTFLLVTHGDIHSLNISPTALIFGIASAVALAIYTLQPISLLQKYNATVVIGWGMLIGGITMCFIHIPWQIEGIWDAHTYGYTFFIVIPGTLIAFYAYLIAVGQIGGQKSSLLASAEPLSATLIAVLWLQTPFELMDWIGSLLIVSTIFMLSVTPSSKKSLSE
ncbi:DMT family transporter [Sphingobacterium sp. SYP-B4668]|uniref:DMT family transporter n=1 Tax=Sphingobacterium sp. SYP-B4668 TaxID=2996035 RepID=UPI0022DE0753|nr:EamA family transporter [Sphingobacterium sp. SYP-B4668]